MVVAIMPASGSLREQVNPVQGKEVWGEHAAQHPAPTPLRDGEPAGPAVTFPRRHT